MRITRLRIDGQFFHLDEDQDTATLKREIIAAASAGPRFIDFTAIGHGEVSVLMTPQMGARFEVLERSQEEIDEWNHNPPVVDYDPLVHD
ncbi:hypothetical protein SOM11_13475 [Frigoribacterium sp. CFBP9039]|uniref:hypothetical protein n=1 Tax=Frigoribacterium TaxID=96492 RepID=UPI001783458F|nr:MULTISPECIES: hypothetical protein [Frigoribacterium]MBD8703950.1 hypothetical protein [Frigoribacterium sp. CFBP 13712]MCJ0701484.1 hypothetical protein [Frigoribacterium faeni]MDY0947001.1 hypothetical protein [Frigoribacterium sp. CFBP9039]